MGLAQAPVPPELAAVREIPNLVKQAELRLNLTKPLPSELVITANSEADAQRLVAIANDLKQLAAAKMMEESGKALASKDPVEQAMGRYSQRMARLMQERTQLVVEGDRLILFRAEMAKSPESQLWSVATVGVLVALLLPAVQAAREAARRNVSANNMKQIMLALLNYESAKRGFPAHANYDANGKPLLSWRVHILPFMEEHVLYSRFHLDEPWDSPHNKQLLPLMPKVYQEPSSGLSEADDQFKTHYLGVVGEPYVFTGNREGRKIKQITDGTANTIAVVQVDDAAAVPWTKPDDWRPNDANLMEPFDRSLHTGVFLAAFVDGHITAVANQVDPATLKAMLTVGGGEVAGPGE
jgi:hypothetical protein